MDAIRMHTRFYFNLRSNESNGYKTLFLFLPDIGLLQNLQVNNNILLLIIVNDQCVTIL